MAEAKKVVERIGVKPEEENMGDVDDQQQAEHDLKAECVMWNLHVRMDCRKLNVAEGAADFLTIESAVGSCHEMNRELKRMWATRKTALEEEKYWQELAILEEIAIRIAGIDRRSQVAAAQNKEMLDRTVVPNVSRSPKTPGSLKNVTKLPKFEMPKFAGEAIEWKSFLSQFEAAVDRNEELADVTKFQYLLAACSGNAKKLIDSFKVEDDSYKPALEILKLNYESPVLIETALTEALRALPKLSSMKPISAVKTQVATAAQYARKLGLFGAGGKLAGRLMMMEILAKFPHELVLKHNSDCRPDLRDIDSMFAFFTEQIMSYELSECALAQQPSADAEQKTKAAKVPTEKSPGTMANLFTADAGKTKKLSPKSEKKVVCPFCAGDHAANTYTVVVDLEKRVQHVQSNRLCWNYLHTGHPVRTCPVKLSCWICGKRHYTSICRITKPKEVPPLAEVKTEGGAVVMVSEEINASLMVSCDSIQLQAFTAIASNEEGESIVVRGVLDTAAHRSFVTESLAKRLNLKRERRINMKTWKFEEAPKSGERGVYHLMLQLRFGGPARNFEVFSATELSEVKTCTDPGVRKMLEMQQLPLAEHFSVTSSQVDVLVGSDYLWAVGHAGRRRLTEYAGLTRTMFGWVFNGVVSIEELPRESVTAMCCAEEVHRIEDLWRMEAIGIVGAEKESDFVRKEFEETVLQEPNGRYSVAIPFNRKIEKLSSNWNAAISQDVLRYLWVKPEYFSKPYTWEWFFENLEVLRMIVVPFGLNASSFLLCAVIRRQARIREKEFE
uniref:Uncharacterized protein n=1 Tax=Strigamia maritima TaxID=126957 RepID=T1IH57_STRMM